MDFLIEGEAVLFNFEGGLSYMRRIIFGEMFITNYRLIIVASSIYRNPGDKGLITKHPFNKFSTISAKKDLFLSFLGTQKIAESLSHLDNVYQIPTTRVLKKKAKKNQFIYKVIMEYENKGEHRTKVVRIIIQPKRNKALQYSEYLKYHNHLFSNLDKLLKME